MNSSHYCQDPVTFERGDRISQMVLARLFDFAFEEAEELGDTERGAGGWGSSGGELIVP